MPSLSVPGSVSSVSSWLEPVASESAPSDPAVSDPAESDQVVLELVVSEPVVSGLGVSELVVPEPAASGGGGRLLGAVGVLLGKLDAPEKLEGIAVFGRLGGKGDLVMFEVAEIF